MKPRHRNVLAVRSHANQSAGRSGGLIAPTRNRQTQQCLLGLIFACASLLLFFASPTGASGLLIADGGFGGVLEIKEHNVRVTINNGIAVTEVEQIFLNTENRQVEALYTFPVPKNASVANFSMWIDGREMIGEVVEKKRAREIYDSYKQRRRDPGLLEQVDYNTFEMRIFPIAARAEQRIKITYYQELDIDHDWATYTYPLATDTRSDIDQRTTGRFSLQIDASSEVPIVDMQSPSHATEFVVAEFDPGYWQASLETIEGDLARDVVLAYRLSRPHTGIDIITSKQTNEDGYLALTLTVGEELAHLDVGMDYVFILDVSGSMARDGKLQLSIDGISAFIDALGPEDRFEVMSFNVQANTLFDRLMKMTDKARQNAHEFLTSRQARGGTSLNPALEAAYRYGDPDRTMNIVIFSDGMTDQAERQALLQLSARGQTNSRVFCIGIGNEVDRPLLSQLAEEAGGLAAFISRGDDFTRQAAAFRRKLTRPAATNVAISFAGDNVFDVEPKVLANLFHGSPLRLYARYREPGPIDLTLSADVMGRPLERTVTLDLPDLDDSSPQIERMWAWHQVQRLLREADRNGTRSSVIDRIVELGERYSISTEYTSFIVLENNSEYKRWKISQRNADRLARDRRSLKARRAQFEKLRDRAAAALGPDPSVRSKISASPSNQTARRQTIAPKPGGTQSSQDLNFPNPGGNGGGAIDPITGAIVVSLVCGGLVPRRRRRWRSVES